MTSKNDKKVRFKDQENANGHPTGKKEIRTKISTPHPHGNHLKTNEDYRTSIDGLPNIEVSSFQEKEAPGISSSSVGVPADLNRSVIQVESLNGAVSNLNSSQIFESPEQHLSMSNLGG